MNIHLLNMLNPMLVSMNSQLHWLFYKRKNLCWFTEFRPTSTHPCAAISSISRPSRDEYKPLGYAEFNCGLRSFIAPLIVALQTEECVISEFRSSTHVPQLTTINKSSRDEYRPLECVEFNSGLHLFITPLVVVIHTYEMTTLGNSVPLDFPSDAVINYNQPSQ